jgi:predicted Zn-dependent protease
VNSIGAKPGVAPDRFRSHPPTDDRIGEAQRNIQEMLEPRPECVATTSEFDSVRDRLARMLATRRPTHQDPNKPTLRRRPDSDRPMVSKGDSGDDRDERLTLERTG